MFDVCHSCKNGDLEAEALYVVYILNTKKKLIKGHLSHMLCSLTAPLYDEAWKSYHYVHVRVVSRLFKSIKCPDGLEGDI